MLRIVPSPTPPPVAEILRNWFVAERPSIEVALAQVDEARARGHITRDEYLTLLDGWPANSNG